MSVPRPRLPSQTSQVLLCVLALTKTLQILHLQNLPRIDNRVQSQGISPSSSNASIEYPVTSIRYPEINHATSSPTHTMIQTDREKETGRQRLRGREKEQRKEKQMQRQRQSRSIRETSRNRRDRG